MQFNSNITAEGQKNANIKQEMFFIYTLNNNIKTRWV